jgi:hypothetical protein
MESLGSLMTEGEATQAGSADIMNTGELKKVVDTRTPQPRWRCCCWFGSRKTYEAPEYEEEGGGNKSFQLKLYEGETWGALERALDNTNPVSAIRTTRPIIQVESPRKKRQKRQGGAGKRRTKRTKRNRTKRNRTKRNRTKRKRTQ